MDEAWQPIAYNSKGIIINWREKNGTRREETCVGIWCSEDKCRYLLSYKDPKKIVIEADNITEIRFSKIT